MSRDDPQMKIRLPAELKARIEESSTANNRTMNAEIVARLVASFATVDAEHLDRDPTGELHARMLALEKRVAVTDALEKLTPALALLERIKPALELAEKLAPPPEMAKTLKAAQAMSEKLRPPPDIARALKATQAATSRKNR